MVPCLAGLPSLRLLVGQIIFFSRPPNFSPLENEALQHVLSGIMRKEFIRPQKCKCSNKSAGTTKSEKTERCEILELSEGEHIRAGERLAEEVRMMSRAERSRKKI